MKISFVTTVYNEEKTIHIFLDSLFSQTQLPDEIVIVDAQSDDRTVEEIMQYKSRFKNKKKNIRFSLFLKKGNRSVGRNEAIRQATGDIIICSDAGCILDKNWVKKITEPFNNNKIDVVAGFYHPVTKNIFEKCLATYTSLMLDKVDAKTFLPSSRSVAFRKSVWGEIKGYPENLDTCEDLVFARNLKRRGFRFFFAKDAIVYWPQRHNLKEAFFQFYSYAKGDGQAWYIRLQTPFLFLRYLAGILLVVVYLAIKSIVLLNFLFLILFMYILWTIKKNYRYVRNWQAFYYLPILQFTSDFAVMSGFVVGLLTRR